MLKIVSSIAELNIDQYLAVYRQSNQDFKADEQMLTYLREDFFSIKGAVCALWVVNGRYVTALRLEPHKNGYLITALETAPQDRRKGYAKSLLQAVMRKYCLPIYSHVAKNNKPSLHLHLVCGFQVYADCATLLDGTVSQNYSTLLYHK